LEVSVFKGGEGNGEILQAHLGRRPDFGAARRKEHVALHGHHQATVAFFDL
jgi:hypothetical protein